MDIIQQALRQISHIDQALAELTAERADWQALIDAAARLGPRLAAPPIDANELARSEFSPLKQLLRAPVQAAQKTTSVAGGRTTKKEQVLALAVSLLADGRYMQAKQLADAMVASGIDLGIDPTGYASVILSRDGRFKSERAKGGWTLLSSPNKEEAPQGVDAPAGPDLLDFSVPEKDTGTVAG